MSKPLPDSAASAQGMVKTRQTTTREKKTGSPKIRRLLEDAFNFTYFLIKILFYSYGNRNIFFSTILGEATGLIGKLYEEVQSLEGRHGTKD